MSNKSSHLVAHLSRFVDFAERAILVVGSLLLILWLVEPSREWLREHNIVDEHTIIAFAPLAILFMLRAFEGNSARLDQLIRNDDSAMIPEGIGRVYERLKPVIDNLANSRSFIAGRARRRIDLLGITLFTAWSNVQIYLQDSRFSDFEITFSCVTPEFIEQSGVIPNEWAAESRQRIAEIHQFLLRKRVDLAARNIVVKLFTYAHLPAIHGFRVENDEIFCSFIHWEGRTVAKPFQFYEHFPAANRSLRAEFYRALFDNWLERAQADGPLPIETDAQKSH